MEKNKIEIKLPVEEVDNLCKTFDWISSSIEFWKLDKEYPTNLIKKVSDDFYDYLTDLLEIYKASKSKNTPRSVFSIDRVSLSHINDK